MNYRARSRELKRIFEIWRIGLSQRGWSDGDRGDGTCTSIPRKAALHRGCADTGAAKAAAKSANPTVPRVRPMRPTPSITCLVARRTVHGGNWIFGMTTRLLQTTSSALAVVASLFMISCSDTASAPQSRGSAPLRQFRLDARPTNIAQLIEISLGEVVAGSVVDATVRVTNQFPSLTLGYSVGHISATRTLGAQ